MNSSFTSKFTSGAIRSLVVFSMAIAVMFGTTLSANAQDSSFDYDYSNQEAVYHCVSGQEVDFWPYDNTTCDELRSGAFDIDIFCDNLALFAGDEQYNDRTLVFEKGREADGFRIGLYTATGPICLEEMYGYGYSAWGFDGFVEVVFASDSSGEPLADHLMEGDSVFIQVTYTPCSMIYIGYPGYVDEGNGPFGCTEEYLSAITAAQVVPSVLISNEIDSLPANRLSRNCHATHVILEQGVATRDDITDMRNRWHNQPMVVFVAGGQRAISDETVSSMTSFMGEQALVIRVYGPSRIETASALNALSCDDFYYYGGSDPKVSSATRLRKR